MGYALKGNWKAGYAADLHTLSSQYLGQDEFGHDRYKNKRSDIGELVYQLKYQNNYNVVNKIIDLLPEFDGIEIVDAIIPIPPSNKNRIKQPVYTIAIEFGKRFNIPVYLDTIEKNANSKELKSISDNDERNQALKHSMFIANNQDLSGKNVLLIDDLYCSGSTLRAATDLLYTKLNIKNVYVITMTKTRSNR